MIIRCGVDIINIDLAKSAISNPKNIAKRLNAGEIKNSNDEHLFGRIALKEAVFKAIGDLVDKNWLDIFIEVDGGKPIITLTKDIPSLESIDGSISHHGDYVVAFVTILLNDEKQ